MMRGVPDFVCDPHTAIYQEQQREIYRTLRDEYPVYHNPERNIWILSRYEDVKSALLDTETFTVEGVESALKLPPQLTYIDGPRHTKLRNLVSRGFTPRRIAETETRVQEITHSLLDRIDERGNEIVELRAEFASQLPSRVIAEMIGVPEQRRQFLLEQSECMIESGPAGHDFTEPAGKILALFDDLLAQRRATPTDDLMSVLISTSIDGEHISEEELLGFCFLLLTGGNDTTMNLIGNGAVLLADHPDQRKELVENPALIPTAIEEILRMEAPVQALARRPTRDVELHGVRIPANSRVLVHFAAANHDERTFEDPDRFDIHRPDKRHLSFSYGSHFCMGASLARIEARIAFEQLLSRYPEYELATEPGWVTSRWARSHPEVLVRLRRP